MAQVQVPKKIAKYELFEEVGRGTCGVVYRAHDPFVSRDVAMKIAFSNQSYSPEQTLQHDNDFFAEAHAAGKLSHPNIVALYDAGVKEGFRYIVMEYVKGHTLLEHIDLAELELSMEQKVDAIFRCCKALSFAHQLGVVHRDIKPSNIMRTDDGETKIMDYSIATIMEGDSIDPDKIVGSPTYMSPEQILKKGVGRHSDLYSLGAVAFHLISGKRPFEGNDVQQVMRDVVNKTAPKLSEVMTNVPSFLSDIVAKAMSKDPQDRFASCHEFAEQLTKAFNILRYQERRIAKLENRDALKSLDFFKDFADEEIEEIIGKSEFISFSQGQAILNEGDIDHAFYIIARGEVNVQKGKKSIAQLHQGDCFGEVGFLTEHKRTATVTAKDDVLVLKINSISIDAMSTEAQLNYYKAFNETLIYRLLMTSARLSAAEAIG